MNESDNKLPINVSGLSTEEVIISREKAGTNTISYRERSGWLIALINTVKEPMFLLLVAASIIYFISGSTDEGIFMVCAILLVSFISLYQDSRSRNALAALKHISQPHATVVRNSVIEKINIEDLVLNDIIIVEEGTIIPADATIIYSNDFSVNESMLTGESLPVEKNIRNVELFRGTLVAAGMAIATITAIGNLTKMGQIGKSLQEIKEESSPLQLQIENFVKKMAIAGLIVFIIVWGINFYQTNNILGSLLKALTLAMSILPEEIPVAFTTFMALGAWRLMQLGIIVKQTQTVEALGSATVICTDKTGTITQNKMQPAALFVQKTNKYFDIDEWNNEQVQQLITTAMWASEPMPFDAMEIALHEAYQQITDKDERRLYKMIHEYPLAGRPPMMTHIFENELKELIVATKGAPEKIIECCDLSITEKENIVKQVKKMAVKGYRVLAVATNLSKNKNFPSTQEEIIFHFIGLVSFYDPPKSNIPQVFNAFTNAGINVKIITGDNKTTTTAIAKQTGFINNSDVVDGDDLMKLNNGAFNTCVKNTNIFTRMFPEAKLRIIEALKANGEIVAMTGDGVNDGPALKAAHIGIAMGKRGTEIAKSAASLILADDDLAKMVDAVAMGRKIYSNLKKAIQYIISIHIPIILTVLIPLVMGWVYSTIFTPVHVIIMEIIMGPTCSIIYENEPMEENLMLLPPRPFSKTFLTWHELNISIFQGLAITAGTLFVYQYAVHQGYDEVLTRTMVFTTLLIANIFLTLVNRSFYYSVIKSFSNKNNLIVIILVITSALILLLLYVKPISDFFKITAPTFGQLIICKVTALLSVIWIEVWKWRRRYKPVHKTNR